MISFVVSKNINETIDDILWWMPGSQVLRLASFSIQAANGKISPTYREKYISKKTLDKLEEIKENKKNGKN